MFVSNKCYTSAVTTVAIFVSEYSHTIIKPKKHEREK